jgi:hypothetical protein
LPWPFIKVFKEFKRALLSVEPLELLLFALLNGLVKVLLPAVALPAWALSGAAAVTFLTIYGWKSKLTYAPAHQNNHFAP